MAVPIRLTVMSLKLLLLLHLFCRENLTIYVMFISVSISVILKNSFI